jgi:hypothetical protein
MTTEINIETKERKQTSINIDKEAYQRIKQYCNYRNIKISRWAEKLLLKEIEPVQQLEFDSPIKT